MPGTRVWRARSDQAGPSRAPARAQQLRNGIGRARGGLALAFASLVVASFTAGCGREATHNDRLQVTWDLEPRPPAVGASRVSMTLLDPDGRAIRGARLRLEGHMTHPGMAPVLAAVRETSLPGHYEADLSFSMSGDWVLVLSGELPDGRRLQRELAVPGVQQAP